MIQSPRGSFHKNGEERTHFIYQVSFREAMVQLRAANQLASALDFVSLKALSTKVSYVRNHRQSSQSTV